MFVIIACWFAIIVRVGDKRQCLSVCAAFWAIHLLILLCATWECSQGALRRSQRTEIQGISKKPRSGLTFDMQAMLISSLDQLNFILDVQMSRPLRIEFVGALYHVIARGNAREDI